MDSKAAIRSIDADSLCWKIIPCRRVAGKNQSESGTVWQMAKDAFNSYMAVPSTEPRLRSKPLTIRAISGGRNRFNLLGWGSRARRRHNRS
jgi:hypothetical protein